MATRNGVTGTWNDTIFRAGREDFEELALRLFAYQYNGNKLYRDYADAIGRFPGKVKHITEIPFLPISFFKTHTVAAGQFEPAIVFTSSGTGGRGDSHHPVKDLALYEQSFLEGFRLFYGDIKKYSVMALLPSYLERKGSSLVYMAEKLIGLSQNKYSRFYLDEPKALLQALQAREEELTIETQDGQKNLLLGVTFALLDMEMPAGFTLNHTIVMETGGMKGRRKEMIRSEVHSLLKQKLGVNSIHSEYGMTELLSQAYSFGEGVFNCPPWMKILVREEEDPLSVKQSGTGAINVIDLANVHSCCFIATDDAAKLNADGSFEVLGRLDGSDIRGCSLLTV